jgi:hypothetical protein
MALCTGYTYEMMKSLFAFRECYLNQTLHFLEQSLISDRGVVQPCNAISASRHYCNTVSHHLCFILNTDDAFELPEDTPEDDLLNAPGLGGICGKKLSPANNTLGGVLALAVFIIISELITLFCPGMLPEVRDL